VAFADWRTDRAQRASSQMMAALYFQTYPHLFTRLYVCYIKIMQMCCCASMGCYQLLITIVSTRVGVWRISILKFEFHIFTSRLPMLSKYANVQFIQRSGRYVFWTFSQIVFWPRLISMKMFFICHFIHFLPIFDQIQNIFFCKTKKCYVNQPIIYCLFHK